MAQRLVARLCASIVASLGALAAGLSAPAGAAATQPAAVTLTASTGTVTLGSSVTFTAVVQGTSPAPSGGVAFLVAGAVACANASLTPSSAGASTASCTIPSVSGGTGWAAVAAVYSGDATYEPASSGIVVRLVGETSATTIASSANPVAPGSSLSYTARVSPSSAGGAVVFSDDGTPITGCAGAAGDAVTISSGAAVCTLAAGYATSGFHEITAHYEGAANHAPSTSTTLVQRAGSATTAASTTTLAVSETGRTGATSPVPTVGAPLGLLAVVTATSAPALGGTVTFLDDGTALPGCGAVPLAVAAGTSSGSAA